MDLVALAQDGAGAKKADACDDLGCNAGRVGGGAEDLETKPREQAGADANQAQGLDPCGVAVELSLETNRDREDRSDEEAKSEVDVAFEVQGLTLSWPAAGLARRLGLIGKLGQVEAVDEVAEDRKSLFVHRPFALLFVV